MPFDEVVEMIKGYWRRKALREKGVIEGASLLCFKFQGIAKHPLVRHERLGNKNLTFQFRSHMGTETGCTPKMMAIKL